MLLKGQANVTGQRPLPVDDKGSAAAITAVTGETVQFYYSNAGVLTIDAGQAAGVLVVGQLAFNNIKNALGNLEGTKQDTSLSFTSTAFTSEVYVDWETMENMDTTTFANRLSTICAGFTNGQYTVDYSMGTIYGKKASTQVTLTSTAYKYQANSTASAGTITSLIPGTGATQLGKAEDAVHASGDTGIEMLGVSNEAQSNLNSADGDYTPIATTRKGNVYTNETLAPQYENNTDGIAWTHTKGISSSTGATTIDKSTALEASTVTKASAGRVYAAEVRVDSTLATGTYYIQWFNNSSLPADSAGTFLTAPAKVQHVSGTDDNLNFNWEAIGGLYCSVGIVMCISTTEFTKTIGTAVLSSNVYYA